MTQGRKASAERVVLAPNVIGWSFFKPECWQVLERWRNGGLRPVLTRDLLLAYIRLLNRLGIPSFLLRRWILWFTAPEKSFYLPKTRSLQIGVLEACAEAARLGQARVIITTDAPPEKVKGDTEEEIRWITPARYLSEAGK